MINTLEDYISDSIDSRKTFVTNPNLVKKVDSDGKFKGFIGNTVVFLLDEAVKNQLTSLQDELYSANCHVLSDRLNPSTFHMTLHDLVNGPGEDPNVRSRMESVAPAVKEILSQWMGQEPLRMRATWMFNMVNTSIVLGLKPADEDSLLRLDRMYCRLEKVLTLGYGLCPHITLSYFRPGQYSPEQIDMLREKLRPVDMEVFLRMEDLVLQNFDDMNCYYNV